MLINFANACKELLAHLNAITVNIDGMNISLLAIIMIPEIFALAIVIFWEAFKA